MSQKAYRKFKRSGSDRCPISGYAGPLVEHHINGREIRNANAPWNIAWVSPNIHDQIHQGEIVIEGWFMSTKGRTLLWHRVGEQSISDDAKPPLYGDAPQQ